jgi:hypothetical protein
VNIGQAWNEPESLCNSCILYGAFYGDSSSVGKKKKQRLVGKAIYPAGIPEGLHFSIAGPNGYICASEPEFIASSQIIWRAICQAAREVGFFRQSKSSIRKTSLLRGDVWN